MSWLCQLAQELFTVSLKTKTKTPLTPGQRWMLTAHAPVPPKFLDKIETFRKRDTDTGTLWVRDIGKNGWCPDTKDPATFGVLLATARSAKRSPNLAVAPASERWWVINEGSGEVHTICSAEDEALVATLETP